MTEKERKYNRTVNFTEEDLAAIARVAKLLESKLKVPVSYRITLMRGLDLLEKELKPE